MDHGTEGTGQVGIGGGAGGLLAGKRILVTGVATQESIAFAIAREAQLAGAEVVLSSFGRMRRITERSAARLPHQPLILELDVTRPEDFVSLRSSLSDHVGALDGIVHAIAFAPPDALGGKFMETPQASAAAAFATSAFSLKELVASLLPLLRKPGGSVVGLDFDAQVSWPAYDWMGVSKAALEAVSRYIARDVGPLGVRVNLVAAGPVRTLAFSGIPGISHLEEEWSRRAPLGWETTDPTPIAHATCFLLSDWSRAITAERLHVDGGFHSVGLSDLPESDALAHDEAAGRTPERRDAAVPSAVR